MRVLNNPRIVLAGSWMLWSETKQKLNEGVVKVGSNIGEVSFMLD